MKVTSFNPAVGKQGHVLIQIKSLPTLVFVTYWHLASRLFYFRFFPDIEWFPFSSPSTGCLYWVELRVAIFCQTLPYHALIVSCSCSSR